MFIVCILAMAQTFQFLFFSNIYASDSIIKAADFVNREFPGKSVGVLNSIGLASLIDSKDRYLHAYLTGLPPIGGDFISSGIRPEILIFSQDGLVDGIVAEIPDSYEVFSSFYGYEIHRIRK